MSNWWEEAPVVTLDRPAADEPAAPTAIAPKPAAEKAGWWDEAPVVPPQQLEADYRQSASASLLNRAKTLATGAGKRFSLYDGIGPVSTPGSAAAESKDFGKHLAEHVQQFPGLEQKAAEDTLAKAHQYYRLAATLAGDFNVVNKPTDAANRVDVEHAYRSDSPGAADRSTQLFAKALRDIPVKDRPLFMGIMSDYMSGREAPERSFLGKLAERGVRGQHGVGENLIGSAMHFTRAGDREKQGDNLDSEEWRFIQAVQQARRGADPATTKNWIGRGLLAATEMMPALAGSTIAGLAGGPKATTAFWMTQTAAPLYEDLRSHGIDETKAKGVALVASLPIAAIETLQFGQLAKPIAEEAKQIGMQTLRQHVTHVVVEGGKTYTHEMVEEAAQEGLELASKKVAEYLDKEAPRYDWRAELKASGNELTEAALAMPFLMAPGAGVHVGKTLLESKQAAADAIAAQQPEAAQPSAPAAEAPVAAPAPEVSQPAPKPKVPQSIPIPQAAERKKFEPTREAAESWATANPEAAKALAEKAGSGKQISRNDFVKAGLPGSAGLADRTAFAAHLAAIGQQQSETAPPVPEPAATTDFEPGPIPATGEVPSGKWSQTPVATQQVEPKPGMKGIAKQPAAQTVAAQAKVEAPSPAPEVSSTDWLASQPQQEPVLAAMRAVRAQSDRYHARASELSPRGGAIAVGGAHFDEFVRGDALSSFLRGLSKGLSPEAAEAQAKVDARDAVAKWNQGRKKDHQVHRWEGTADSVIEAARRQIEQAAAPVASEQPETIAPETIAQPEPQATKGSEVSHGATPAEPDVNEATAAAPVPSAAPASFATQPAETKGGERLLGKLQKDAASKGAKRVGLRSIVDFLNNELGVLMFVGKSQTTKRNPANYRRSVHIVRARAGYWQLNIHEAGHAISSILSDKLPDWRRGFGSALEALTHRHGSMASAKTAEEGIAEFARLFVVDHAAIPPQLAKGLLAAMDKVDPRMSQLLRDTHRAYQLHRARPLIDQMQSLQNDHGKKPSLEQAASDLMTQFIYSMAGGSAVIHRLLRRAYLGIGGDTKFTKYDPTGLAGLAKSATDAQYRDAQKLAREVLGGLEDTPADIETAYQATIKIPSEVWRAIGGVIGGREGVRVRSTGGGFSHLSSDQQKALKELGFRLPDPSFHGDWIYLGNKSISRIKHEVGEGNWEAFVTYGQYRAALDRFKRDGHQYPGIIDGLRPGVVAADLKQMEANNPTWGERFKDINDYMDQLLLVGHLAGEFSLEDLARIKTAYEDYWPLPRQVEDRTGKGSGAGVEPTAGVRSAFGSQLPFRSLDEAIEVRTKMALEAYYTNRLMLSLKDFSRTIGEDERLLFDARKQQMQIMLPLTMDKHKAATLTPMEEATIVADAVNRRTLEDGGYPSEGLTSAQLAAAVEENIGPESVAKPEDVVVSRPAVALWRLRKPNAIHVIAPWENGERAYYQLPDPLLFDLFTRTRNPNRYLGMVARTVGGVVPPWKRALTQNWVFALANMLSRDAATAMFAGKGMKSLIPYFYTATAIIHRLKGGTTAAAESELLSRALDATSQDAHRGIVGKFFDMLKEGVVVPGWSQTSFSDKVAMLPGQAMSAALKPIDAINFLSGSRYVSALGEELTREGAFLQELRNGASDERAQLEYDRITGNFGERPGNANLAAFVRTTGFLNPAIQIGWGQIQRITHPDPAVRAQYVAAKLPAIAMIGAAGAAVNFLFILAAHDPEDRDAILQQMRERQDRDRMSHMAIAGKVRLPFDYGPIGAMFSYGWNSVEGWLLDDPVSAEEKAKGFLGRFGDVPGLGDAINPQVKTLFEADINHSFWYDREIVAGFLEEKYPYNPELQSMPDTPQAYDEVAGALAKTGVKVSPLKIQYVVQQAFARQYDELAKAFDRYQTDRPFEAADLPLIGRMFLREPRGFTSQSVRTLVDLDGEYKSLVAAIKDGVTQRPDDPELMGMAKRVVELSAAHRQMLEVGKLWDDVRLARRSNGTGGDRVAALERRMTQTARAFLEGQPGMADKLKAKALAEIRKDVTPPPARKLGESLEKYQARVAGHKQDSAAAKLILKQARPN